MPIIKKKEEIVSPQPAWEKGSSVKIQSRDDNTFCFGAIGDLHAASKYCRWDVREDLIRRIERRGATAIFDTGNWIDGEHPRINKHSLKVHGMTAQLEYLAENHPRTKLPIYAVTGDDHEGWYAQREGIDIGKLCESTMREHKHNWFDLGYIEAYVTLVNKNSGKKHVLDVMHPGGGSSYATSYRPQKIIESLEGGEKPAVILIGHYHKLIQGIVRNVWYIQTGCAQDQTPFLRKKSIEAHVGGAIVDLEQDPRTGAIISCRAELIHYYGRGYHELSKRYSMSGNVRQPLRVVK